MHVSPTSSLIFVVVIVTWAICLSLYAMRRREQLTTARSVDRFSAHMRVLQRRSGQPVPRPEPVTSSGAAQSSMLVAASRVEVVHLDQGEMDDLRASRRGAAWVDDVAPNAARGHGRLSRPTPGLVGHTVRMIDGATHAVTGVAKLAFSLPSAPSAVRGGVRANAATARFRRGDPDGGKTGVVRPNHAFAVWGSLTAASARQVRAAAFGLAVVVAVASFLLGAFDQFGWVLPVVAGMAAFGLMGSLRRNRQVVVAGRRRREPTASKETQRVATEHMAVEHPAVEHMAVGARLAPLDAAPSQAHVVRRGRRSASEARESMRRAAGGSTADVARRDLLERPQRPQRLQRPEPQRRPPRSSPDVPFDVVMFEEQSALRSRVGAKREVCQRGPSGAGPVSVAGAVRAAGMVPLEAMSEWELDASVLPPGLDPSDPLVAERSWQPVPVPVPTYVMKAPARRPVPAREVPVPIEIEDDFDDVLWPAGKRVVNA